MTAVVQALSAALDATEEQQFAVCEALALAPRELLSEEYLDMSSGPLSYPGALITATSLFLVAWRRV